MQPTLPSADQKWSHLALSPKRRGHHLQVSVFREIHYTIPDILMFLKNPLDGHTLLECCKQSGMSYQSSGVDGGSYIRELFARTLLGRTTFTGQVDIDHPMFG